MPFYSVFYISSTSIDYFCRNFSSSFGLVIIIFCFFIKVALDIFGPYLVFALFLEFFQIFMTISGHLDAIFSCSTFKTLVFRTIFAIFYWQFITFPAHFRIFESVCSLDPADSFGPFFSVYWFIVILLDHFLVFWSSLALFNRFIIFRPFLAFSG